MHFLALLRNIRLPAEETSNKHACVIVVMPLAPFDFAAFFLTETNALITVFFFFAPPSDVTADTA